MERNSWQKFVKIRVYIARLTFFPEIPENTFELVIQKFKQDFLLESKAPLLSVHLDDKEHHEVFFNRPQKFVVQILFT